jgi:hypothetical protein
MHFPGRIAKDMFFLRLEPDRPDTLLSMDRLEVVYWPQPPYGEALIDVVDDEKPTDAALF